MTINLFTAKTKAIAALVINGTLQIDEIPAARRSAVAVHALYMEPIEPEPLKQINEREIELTELTVAELLVITRDYPSISREHSMRKYQLITAILEAEEAEEEVDNALKE